MTRYYLPSSGVAETSPAFSAWDKTSGADRLKCVQAKVASAMSSKTSTEASAAIGYTFLTRQYVSAPIGAGEISGTVKGQIRCLESSRQYFCRAIIIKVVSNDGSVERGALLTHIPGAVTSEYSQTALTNRYFPPAGTALTPVTALNGDRIVIEIGTVAFNSSATSYTATHSFGDNAASDLAEDESATTADNPWVEFSATIPAAILTQDIADSMSIGDFYDILFTLNKGDSMAILDEIEVLKIRLQEISEGAVGILDDLAKIITLTKSDSVGIADQIAAYIYRPNSVLARYNPALLVDMLFTATYKFSSRDLHIDEGG